MSHKDFILQVHTSMKELLDYSESIGSNKVDMVFNEACKYIFKSGVTVKIEMSIQELHPSYNFDYIDPLFDDQSKFKCFFYAIDRYLKNCYKDTDNEINLKIEEIFSTIS